MAHLVEGDTTKAIAFLKHNISELKNRGNFKYSIDLSAELGFLNAEMKNTREVEVILQQVSRLSDSLDYLHGRVLSALLKAEHHQLQNQQSKALLAAKEAEEFSEISRRTNKSATKRALSQSLLNNNQPERAISI